MEFNSTTAYLPKSEDQTCLMSHNITLHDLLKVYAFSSNNGVVMDFAASVVSFLVGEKDFEAVVSRDIERKPLVQLLKSNAENDIDHSALSNYFTFDNVSLAGLNCTAEQPV
jgi:hypothetical protein